MASTDHSTFANSVESVVHPNFRYAELTIAANPTADDTIRIFQPSPGDRLLWFIVSATDMDTGTPAIVFTIQANNGASSPTVTELLTDSTIAQGSGVATGPATVAGVGYLFDGAGWLELKWDVDADVFAAGTIKIVAAFQAYIG